MEMDHQKSLPVYLHHLWWFLQTAAVFHLGHSLSESKEHWFPWKFLSEKQSNASDLTLLWASFQFSWFVPEPGDKEQEAVQTQAYTAAACFLPTAFANNF